jgi:hypothetical protein
VAEHTQGAEISALERGTDTATALAFYDGLPAVAIEDMLGRWRGAELPTGHPLDGLLAKAGWHGKRFDDADGAHPLIFGRGDGSHFAVDPAWIPLGLMTSWLGLAKNLANPGLVRAAALIAGTTKPKARLRMTEYRGVVSATMIYDALPINDVFRRVDRDTVVGAMDMRGHAAPFLFVLRREA